MPVQTREYYMPDKGALLSATDGGAPLRLSEAEVRELCRVNSFGLPIGFFVEMIRSETNFAWNEVDTDYRDGEPLPEKTYGLCQLRKSEFGFALSAGSLSDAVALDPAENIDAFARIMNRYGEVIDALADAPSSFDRLCYLAWAHNNGIGAVTKSITSYGLDWEKLKARDQNDYMRTRLIPYAERAALAGAYDPTVGNGSDTTLFRLAGVLGVLWLGWSYFLRG